MVPVPHHDIDMRGNINDSTLCLRWCHCALAFTNPIETDSHMVVASCVCSTCRQYALERQSVSICHRFGISGLCSPITSHTGSTNRSMEYPHFLNSKRCSADGSNVIRDQTFPIRRPIVNCEGVVMGRPRAEGDTKLPEQVSPNSRCREGRLLPRSLVFAVVCGCTVCDACQYLWRQDPNLSPRSMGSTYTLQGGTEHRRQHKLRRVS